ncbi:MAG: PQQ-binding-like beta-propeller repeat protein [Verrucomicrobia bacterium]|nr:PQQ-binding-like beta-propeller repeat protein [Verrucomicrobiota bacterium]
MKSTSLVAAIAGGIALFDSIAPSAAVNAAPARGWLSWRGPEQNGTSRETGLPEKLAVNQALWTADFPGASTPVIANGQLYIMGYLGDAEELREGIACFDAETGVKLWQQLFSDFLSDIIYRRYATSSPTVDAETGNVYVQGTQGILAAFTREGKRLWLHSMMEEFGRLTFPNGRTASPVIDGDLVITRGITANWGAHGPASDRFYAFDKQTGELVWSSSPGDRPKDNSYSFPYLCFLDGKRVLIATAGDGSVVCVNARTGEPIWRVPLGKAGINATVLVHNHDKVVAVYGTPYEPGQMVAFRIPKVKPADAASAPVIVERSQVELWSQDISTSTSSPILVGDRIYVVAEKGDLVALDVNNGKILWDLKIGIEQRNSCPLSADGKLYVPMLDDPDAKAEGVGSEAGTKGALYVIKLQPNDAQGVKVSQLSLDGRCFGTPTTYNGKIYIQTAKKIYCFGKKGNNPGLAPDPAPEKWPAPGPAAQLQIIPSEVLLRPGQSAAFRVRSLDANGFTAEEIHEVKKLSWASYVPPTAKVKSTLKGSFNANGQLVAANDPVPSAGAFQATLGQLKGYIRGRVLPYLPIQQNFESFALNETTTNTVEEPTRFAYPPLPWIGARFKFEVREQDGTKALTKTIDNKFFQRATVFIGSAEAKNYTIQADVMSEGRMRGKKVLKMSEVGLINQRYVIVLQGNAQKLQVTSNEERFCVPPKEASPNFAWQPNVWYTLKARVDTAPDGSGVVRAKTWKRGDPEPAQWTLEAPHRHAHQSGSPGLFGFAPQDMRVFIDNISVTPN